MSADDHVIIGRVYRYRMAFNDHTKETTEEELDNDLPEELMAKVEDLYGNGEASVTVGGSLGSSREYHKAEAFVSIRMPCNSTMEDAEAVHDIVRPYVNKFAAEDLVEMSKLRDPWLPPHLRLHEPVPQKTGKPPKKDAPTSLPPAVKSTGKSIGKTTVK